MTATATATDRLLAPRSSVDHELANRVARGANLVRRVTPTPTELESLIREAEEWHDFNVDLLGRRFDGGTVTSQYLAVSSPLRCTDDRLPPRDRGRAVNAAVRERVQVLQSVRDLLPQLPEPEVTQDEPARAHHPNQGRVVVVDTGTVLADEVRQFLTRSTGVAPVSPNRAVGFGSAMVADVENRAEGDAVAVVVLTADEISYLPGDDTPHARPAVDTTYAAGYLAGALSVDRVIVLFDEALDLPPRLGSLAHAPLDQRGAWKLTLGALLDQVGIEVDFTRAL